MVGLLFGLFSSSLAVAADPPATPADLTPVFPAKLKKGKWDPKGGTIETYGSGDAKRKQAWGEAIPLLVEALTRQPGCGKCLDSLARTLDGAERYADAAQVGELMVRLYPDRGEGWARVSDAWEHANEFEKAVEATSKYLEIKKDDTNYWARRNSDLVALGRVEDANKLLQDASIPTEDVKCLQIQNLASENKTVEARDLWGGCTESGNISLRRITEGWLVLAEGTDPELAATRLMLAGDNTFVRLVVAFVRLDQKKYDLALNLANKALTESPDALDAHLAHAEALFGLGKTAEALEVLDRHFTGAGWAERNAKLTQAQVLLRMRGETWPAQVAQRAEVLKVAVLARNGDLAGAWALREDILKVNADTPELQNRLQAAMNTPIGNTGVSRAQIQQSLASSAAFKKCQDKERKRNAALAGIVVVGFTLGADGKISDAKAVSRTVTVPELEKCTLTELGKLKFEVGTGAVPASVQFPVAYPL
jgi:tetratricopeptide (TPR) repeat protein